MFPSLIEIGSKTAEKNSAQTNRQTDRQTDTTKIMVTWPWTNIMSSVHALSASATFPATYSQFTDLHALRRIAVTSIHRHLRTLPHVLRDVIIASQSSKCDDAWREDQSGEQRRGRWAVLITALAPSAGRSAGRHLTLNGPLFRAVFFASCRPVKVRPDLRRLAPVAATRDIGYPGCV